MFHVIDLVAAHPVKAWGGSVQVISEPEIKLYNNQVGIVLGKHSFHERGISCFSGIVNPGWGGNITIELSGERIEIAKGEKIAHLLIFTDLNYYVSGQKYYPPVGTINYVS
jgi:deoxycytidine triphosphate deaminase